MTATGEHVSIHPATQIGFASLTVSSLERVLPFYTNDVGFTILQRDGGTVILGASETPLLSLVEDPGAALWTEGYTGLHHIAVLLPSRADLGRLYRRLRDHGHHPIGEDHSASEAIYVDDPEGHRMELYQDRPRDTWGSIGSREFDAEALLAAGSAGDGTWHGLPAGTRIGHMHIRVGDIERAKTFYTDLLGFDVMAQMADALFVSAGGYHHHIGMNTWVSKGASAPPAHMTGLRFFTVTLPDGEALEDVTSRVQAAGIATEHRDGGVILHDLWGTMLLLRPSPRLDLPSAAVLSSMM